MDKEVAIAIEMAIDSQRDFGMKVISVLISIARVLPDEKRLDVANQILELVQEHKAGLEDMKYLHNALHGKSNDGE